MCETESLQYHWKEINESWSHCSETGLWLHKDTHYIYEHHAETNTFTALRPAQVLLMPEELNCHPYRFRIGTATMQGRRPKQEDRLLVVSQFLGSTTPQIALAAPGEVTVQSPFVMVADGHSGSETVEFVISKLAAEVNQNLTMERRLSPGTSLATLLVRGGSSDANTINHKRRDFATSSMNHPSDVSNGDNSVSTRAEEDASNAAAQLGSTQDFTPGAPGQPAADGDHSPRGAASPSASETDFVEPAFDELPAAKRIRIDESQAGRGKLSEDNSSSNSFVEKKADDVSDASDKGQQEGQPAAASSVPNNMSDHPPDGGSASKPDVKMSSVPPPSEADINKAICAAFDDVDQTLIKMNRTLKDGSTATVAFVLKDQLVVAHCGDTRAAWIPRNTDGSLGQAKVITEDHKPDLPRETVRITEAGGIVRKIGPCHRVLSPDQLAGFAANPRGYASALAVSRSFGDRHCKVPRPLLIATPDINRIPLAAGVLVIATDGLWDVVSPEEVQKIVASRTGGGSSASGGNRAVSPRDLAGTLIMKAYASNSTDNITCIVMVIQ